MQACSEQGQVIGSGVFNCMPPFFENTSQLHSFQKYTIERPVKNGVIHLSNLLPLKKEVVENFTFLFSPPMNTDDDPALSDVSREIILHDTHLRHQAENNLSMLRSCALRAIAIPFS